MREFAPPIPQQERIWFGHPRGLLVLFFAELWERFSFYGMRALLTLYMVKELLYADSRATEIYGAYGALIYAFPVIGGAFADRLLGYRRAIMIGAVLMAIGHFVMAIEHEVFFYIALAFLCVGNGFFKPNVSSLVGRLYQEKDPRRDGGFTIFYMGINIGAFLAPLTCGYIGETYGWHFGFGLAGIGMLVGLLVFKNGASLLKGQGEPPDLQKFAKTPIPGLNAANLVLLGSMCVVPLVAFSLWYTKVSSWAFYVAAIAVVTYLIITALKEEKVARHRLFSLMILMVFHTIFWASFEQAGSSLTLFADRNIDRSLFGWLDVKASMLQAVNPGFIFALSPLFASMWTSLGRMNKGPSIPTKFVLGLIQVGLGFALLVWAAPYAGEDGKIALVWLVFAYFLHTTGELCLSPVGLSAATKLAPAQIGGLVMGAWFMSIAFGHHLAGAIAGLTGQAGDVDAGPLESLHIYTDVFAKIAMGAILAGVVLLVLTPLIKRLMHGVR